MKRKKFVALILSMVMLLWQMPQFVLADEINGETDGQETELSDEVSEELAEPEETVQTEPETVETSSVELPSYGNTDEDSYTISSAQDWDDFAARVNDGDVHGHYTLAADITVTSTVGTEAHPFYGTFDGAGHTLNVQINDTSGEGTAPFRYVTGATIKSLHVTGTVTGGIHCAGLVGFSGKDQGIKTTTITDCTVSTTVSGSSHFGGIVGHCKTSVVSMNNCVFDGTLSGPDSDFIGGMAGWGDYYNLDLTDCFFCGTFNTNGAFHPFGFMTYNGSCATDFVDTYYSVAPYNIPSGYSVGEDGAYFAAASQQEGGLNMLYTYGGTTYYIKEKSEVTTDPVYLITDGAVDIVPVVKFGEKELSSDNYTVTIKDSSDEIVTDVTEPGSYTLTAAGIEAEGYLGSVETSFDVVEPLSGEGTYEEPYIISSGLEWTKMALFVEAGLGEGSYYLLTDDIDVSVTVGTAEHPFAGHFLGNGHTVDAEITDTANQGTAPFRYIADAYIDDLNVEGVIQGSTHAAGLVGFVSSGTGTITGCSVSATVDSPSHAGGLIGHAKYSAVVIDGCVFSGHISGAREYIGGLIGWMESADITITGSFFCGSINDYNRPGFHPVAVKSADAVVTSSITDTYYTIAPYNIADSHILGADAGIRVYRELQPDRLNRIVNLYGTDYYETEETVIGTDSPYVIDQGGSASVVPVVTYAGTVLSSDSYTYTITDAEGTVVAQPDKTGDYTLTITGVEAQGFMGSASCSFSVAERLPGEGTEDDPYVISSDQEWEAFVNLIEGGIGTDAWYQLGNDITVTSPAGTIDNPFTGVFDGNGYTITAAITDTGNPGSAPFRYIADAFITDVTVDGEVRGGIHAAGLVGFNLSGESTVSDCTVSADIYGSTHTGGIVGHTRSAKLNMSRCIFSGDLKASSQKTAGLIGWMDAATIVIEECLFSGTNSTSNSTQFHPIALRSTDANVKKTITDCYYLTDPTTTSGGNVLGSNVGTRIYDSAPMAGKGLYETVTIFDGNSYYTVAGKISGVRDYYHSSTGVEIAPVVIDVAGVALTEGTDFEYSMTLDGEPVDSVSVPGTYVLTASATGDRYGGSSSFAFTVYPTIRYMDYVEGTGKFVEKDAPADVNVVTSSMTTWNAGWYVVKGNVTINARVRVAGSPVNLILSDGASLTVKQGITVRIHRDFNVYAQEAGTGSLTCYAVNYGDAALGSAKNYDASPSSSDEGNNYQAYGNITINGGHVTADATTSYYECAAGIGAGRWEYGHGGDYWGNVTINGGTVVARGERGAGIGGGWGGNGGHITIRGGNVTATSRYAAGMGEGSCTINFTWNDAGSGMSVKASRYATPVNFVKGFKTEDGAIYIGNQSNTDPLSNKTLIPCVIARVVYAPGEGSGNIIYKTMEAGEITLLPEDTYTEPAGMVFDGWKVGDDKYGAGETIEVTDDVNIIATWKNPVLPYVDSNGEAMPEERCYRISSNTVTLTDQTSEWYAVAADTEMDSRVTVSGNINLILCDGAVLTAHKGISVTEGNSLTIWRQSGATGTLVVDEVDREYSGIGGYCENGDVYEYLNCGDIVINGGVLNVAGGSNSAAIGGGFRIAGGNITINGGDITSAGSGYGACIGGGNNAAGGNITINGGKITVKNSGKGACIGGGYTGSSGNITITGGIINADNTGGSGACIGGGELGACDIITITGGTITAAGKRGIGRGSNSSGSKGEITVGWTEETENMSVTTSGFDGIVSLTGDFIDDQENILPAGDYSSRISLITNRTIKPYTDVRFAGYSIVLNGEVGINFFMDLSKLSAEERQAGYMTVDITGKGTVTDRADFDPDLRENGYYGFSCSISSIQLADTITATYHYGEDKTVTDTYSAIEYIKYIADHPDIYGQSSVKLAKALADYGHYAQIYLSDSRGWVIGTDYAAIDTFYTGSFDVNEVRAALADYTASTSGGFTDVDLVTYSVTMSSRMKINIYIKPVSGYSGEVSFILDGGECEAETLDDGRYKITIEDLTAPALDAGHTLIINSANDTVTASFSGLSYVKALAETYDETRQNAGCALYCFYRAANEYQD